MKKKMKNNINVALAKMVANYKNVHNKITKIKYENK